MKVTAGKGRADAMIVGVDADRKAPGLRSLGLEKNAEVRRLLKDKKVSLGFKTVRTVAADGWIVLVGLGKTADLTQEKLAAAAAAACRAAASLGCRSAVTTLHTDAGSQEAVQAVVQGAIVGTLDFDQFKSSSEEPKAELTSVKLVGAGKKEVERAAVVADAVNDARLLANTPANIATPKWMASEARARGRRFGFKVSVKGRTQLRKEGFNALCGVAQGSINEEQLIVMDYVPATVSKSTKTLILVGKGVCFDSGGISLKPGQGMWDMKYDKCGACNVIALMGTLRALGVKHRVIGITPCVENMPSATAQRPGDIITAKDGTTIEVLNTDAEGRLILADAITHARTMKPDWIIEMSTLTGACEYAVGKTYVAAMGKDDAFVDSVVDAARRAGDKAWRLPQGEEFDEGNKGTYADIQNISLKVKAGTSIGGAFVGHFAKDTTFCHLDIASKAWVDGQDYFPKGPTGAGLRIALQRILDE